MHDLIIRGGTIHDGSGAEAVTGDVAIKALTGRNARGYRSPAWDLSPHSIELLLKHGFTYDSSLMGHDYLPYQARDGDVISLHEPIRYGPDTPLVEMPISASSMSSRWPRPMTWGWKV